MSSVSDNSSGSDSVSRSVRVSHSRDGRSPSLAVVEGIAELAGVDPEALGAETGVILYDHVDPDALNAIVADHPDASISLPIDEYDVRVEGDEAVVRADE
ncbi:HalOD1 output domain-containing protein [Halorubrum sp. HHNYT27]|uniref:HalOD1 output domain-containing protein n=1 Tax=Halorubrum sp. HHNYT27 TaxID=3402275 RepID=UPI003EBC547D